MPRPLSVLDLLRVMKGESSADAIATSVEMARLAESLGYQRLSGLPSTTTRTGSPAARRRS
jgi:hypothetical protein